MAITHDAAVHSAAARVVRRTPMPVLLRSATFHEWSPETYEPAIPPPCKATIMCEETSPAHTSRAAAGGLVRRSDFSGAVVQQGGGPGLEGLKLRARAVRARTKGAREERVQWERERGEARSRQADGDPLACRPSRLSVAPVLAVACSSPIEIASVEQRLASPGRHTEAISRALQGCK